MKSHCLTEEEQGVPGGLEYKNKQVIFVFSKTCFGCWWVKWRQKDELEGYCLNVGNRGWKSVGDGVVASPHMYP